MTSRESWHALPERVRAAVEQTLGSAVVRADSQANGFSPGSADRVVTSAGRRAFVKAVGRDRGALGYDLHRRELEVMRAMPAEVPAPRLIGSYLDDDWAALVIDDVEGRHPRHTTAHRDAVGVLDAIAGLPTVRAGALSWLPDASEQIAAAATGWSRLSLMEGRADDAGPALPDWVRDRMPRLEAAVHTAAAAVAGDTLVHLDCRSDNVLIDAAEKTWLVDWPWAAIGARWFDGLTYLLDARLHGQGIDAQRLLVEHPLFAGVPAGDIDAVLSAITGMFFEKSWQEAPPAMPTIRRFQRREGLAGAQWLRERWGD